MQGTRLRPFEERGLAPRSGDLSYNFNQSHHNVSQHEQDNNINESNINTLLVNSRQAEAMKNGGKQSGSALSSMFQSQSDNRCGDRMGADPKRRQAHGGARPGRQTSFCFPTFLRGG